MSICPIWNFTLYVTQSLHFFENYPSQDFNITSGSDTLEDNTNLKIVMSEGSVQIITISEDDGIVFQGFTVGDIGQAQWEDPDVRLILNFLKNQVEPEGNELFLSSPKSYWINKQMFFLDKHEFSAILQRKMEPARD